MITIVTKASAKIVSCLGEITLVMGSINELHHARVFDRDGEVMEQKKRKNQVK